MSILTLVTFPCTHIKLLKEIEALSSHWRAQGMKMLWCLLGLL